jgi:hypothetical protein
VPVKSSLFMLAVLLLAACGGGGGETASSQEAALPIAPVGLPVLPAPATAVRNPMEAPR